jgi:hypothetical protein
VDELRALVIAGMLNESSKVAAVGAQEWVSISSVVPDVASAGAAPVAAARPIAAAAPVTGPVVTTRTEGLAVWSFVLSLIGLWCCFLVVLEIPAVICGHLALSRIRRTPQLGGRGLAIAGLIIGYVGLFGWVVYLFLLGGMAAMQSMMPNNK